MEASTSTSLLAALAVTAALIGLHAAGRWVCTSS
ncbi:hypothetical protein HDA32_002848 [Spinactinospora alkalitolerans]|uniref:Uncharacterized protein n=1 Tax=Spinactinospora alkalitolerans TaxID=687207 RepID=A0A852TUW1_9ACTN|nr:hypothetical protein [Spinactinospora alkalitolerans]